MMTHSGRLVSPHEGIPTLPDIALALSRQPRFGGHTLGWWSVLDHSLFCLELAQRDGATPAQRLAVLLHDAHEALTADVPTAFKGADLKGAQAALDDRIADAYYPGGSFDFDEHAPFIHDIDRRALLAEAIEVGPPRLGEMPRPAFVELFGATPRPQDAIVLRGLRTAGGIGTVKYLGLGVQAPNARRFLGFVQALREQLTVV